MTDLGQFVVRAEAQRLAQCRWTKGVSDISATRIAAGECGVAGRVPPLLSEQ
jgi:hypothetical protein